MFLGFDELSNVIGDAGSPVIVVITGACDGRARALCRGVQRRVGSRATVHGMCAELDESPLLVYYSAGDDRPVLSREGPRALDSLTEDLDEAARIAVVRPNREEEALARTREEAAAERMLEQEDLTPFPSTFTMARSLVRDLWHSARQTAAGAPLLLDAEAAGARVQVCESCPAFDDGRCRECGCVMSLKAHLAAADCPLGKWPTVR